MNGKKKVAPGTLRRILTWLKPYAPMLVISIVLSAASVALTLYVPILVGRAIDGILGKGNVDWPAVLQNLTQAAVVAAAAAVIQWIISAINNRVAFQTVRDMRNAAFDHLQELPLSYLDAHPQGEIVSRIIADADTFADGLLLGFTQLFTGVVTIAGTLYFMLRLQWWIALTVVVLTPLSLFMAKFIASRTYSMFRAQSEARGEQTAFVDEMLTGQKVVRAFGREKACLEKFDQLNKKLADSSLKATFYSSLTNPLTRFVGSVTYAAVALVGAIACILTAGTAAAFTVGNLSAMLSYASQYAKPFNEISGVVTEFQNAMACAARLFALMDEPARVPDAPDALVLENARGDVALEDVTFSYTPEKPLIQHMNIRVKTGMRVAIVGPTGCGKTTIINLLMRFYDVCGGKITVDGTDIRDITRKSLRGEYGMVLQDTWLKAGTIRENIAMGRPEATDEEIFQAAKAAHAHSFIRRLPEGYDTVIGEDGGMLSQGQKQLLCIARIMLCLPPMLILDEATSSIDTRTEMKIQSAFAAMMKGRTTFIVAHRLSTIREADLILVMRDGAIVEQGTHESLLAAEGFYAQLYKSQFALS
ncbi:MAG: ABC transporter ATP-binding protein/permease [Clostridiales bacterium]|nr:ABC transporter ATP-binding protein/permease [Clostridiales bacterium]